MERTITSTKEIPLTTNVAMPHKPEGEVTNPIDWVGWDNMGAAGGIISSADDMLKWMDMQLNDGIAGKDTFFTKSSQSVMWTTQNSFTVSARAHELFKRNFSGYGLGWGIGDYFGHLVVTHTGGYDGMYSSVYLLPNDEIGIVVLTNTMNSIGPMLSYEIIDRLTGEPQKKWKETGLNQNVNSMEDRAGRIKERTDARQSGTTPSLSTETIIGLYRDAMYGDIRIEMENDQLYLDFQASPGLKARLSHWHYDSYLINWLEEQAWFSFGTVQILKDNNGNPSGLQFDVPNDDIFFEEIKAVRVLK